MVSRRQSRPPVAAVAGIVGNLRRAPARVKRQSLDVIETAVSQLFDAAVRQPHLKPDSGEYRIDELARLAGTTTRNIRVYRDRGLLHAPLRVGRIALYNDTHLTRLRLITSMLDRGYNIAHVHEMLSAWEQGKNIGEVLGLESAIIGTWAAEKPKAMTRTQARRLIDDDKAYERLLEAGLFRIDEGDPEAVVVLRPTLIEAFDEMRGFGVSIDALIDAHAEIQPHIDAVSDILVRIGFERVQDIIRLGESLPNDTQMAELITMLVRFRTQAVAAVTGTLANSIESTIETLVSRVLAEYIGRPGPSD